MVIKGKARGGAAALAAHLQRTDTNETAALWELRGVAATDLEGALAEMEAVGSGARTQKALYHAAINPRDTEPLTEDQKRRAVDALEEGLGLEGQPRAVVQHVKDGRAHLHVVWSRIDLDRMAAISDSHNYRKHEETARALEREFGHERVQGAHAERDGVERPARTPTHAEMQQLERTGIDPKAMRAELTELWRATDTGQAFAAGLDARGYLLTQGDRRDFVVLDPAGEAHSLARRIEGASAADIRTRMADLDRAALPSVEEGRAIQLDRQAGPVLEPEPPAAAASAGMSADYDAGDAYAPSDGHDAGQAAEQGLYVASDIAGGAAEKLGDFVSNLVNSLGASPPPRQYTVLELATDPAARRAQYAQEGAERRSDEALRQIREHMEAGRALRPEDIRALTPEHINNIRAKGDAYLEQMVQMHEQEERTKGLSRNLERD